MVSLAWFIKVLKQMTLLSRRGNRARSYGMSFSFRRTGLSSCLIIGFVQVARKADCSLLIQQNTLSLPYQAVVSARQGGLWGLVQGKDSPAIDGAIPTLQNQGVLWSLIYQSCAEEVLILFFFSSTIFSQRERLLKHFPPPSSSSIQLPCFGVFICYLILSLPTAVLLY